ncbi:CMRF35-like molecule 8 isoform X2 [Larimichthys crocea]|uniref:CMRF35-like molecule 8 isoform X2 n=1 Tax=Larimichthys crocea TaxID=215358 RepID=UPI000F5F3769|nr:CMRF35-like molecule 8 isoform X2 [Larimichthys crocea]
MQSSKNNEWETTDSVSLYRDTNNKKVRVLIKKLKQEDFAEYQCEEQGSDFDTVKLDKDRVGCKGEFIQTVYRTAKTTITCNYPRDESDVLFFCKENKITCEDNLSESSPKSNETFTLTKTNTSFTVSISKVSSHHAGVYWCGVKSNEGSYRAGFRKIQLQVKDIRNFTSSLTIGQNFTYWCAYPFGTPMKKFICKGEDPSICEPLVNTMQLNKNTGRFSMEDDRNKNITITVREVTTDDTGTYWCGAKSTDNKHSNTFFHRFSMIVAQSTTTSTSAENNAPTPTQTSTPTPTSGVSSAQSTTTSTSAENNGGSWLLTVCVGVLLVLFVLILFFIYKRFSHSKNARNEAAAQNIREVNDYEELEEHVHNGNSGNATANCSTDPSGSLHYATINFQKHSSKAGGRKAVILKPSLSACEYSTVKCSQSPTYYNVNSYLEHPLYSTVKKQKTTERVYMV